MELIHAGEMAQLREIIEKNQSPEDFDLTAYIAQVISITGVSAIEGWYDGNANQTHITFFYLVDVETNYSDDENENIEHCIQVDIWSRTDIYLLKKKVKKLLKHAGFNYVSGQDSFEPETGIYHKAMRFFYLE